MTYMPKQKWSQMVRGGNARIAERFGIDPLTARVLLNRDLSDEEQIRRYLYGTLEDLENPLLMNGLSEAASLLHACILKKEKIRVIGDYDADGIFSTYILVHSLRAAGGCVSYDIPDRITDGFGMSQRLVERAYQDGIQLIITCDNGIAQTAEAARAKRLGMKVVITDHHEPNFTLTADGSKEFQLPDADVIVDPKQPGCPYPNKNLCGAGVAWKLMYLYESRYLTDGGKQQSEGRNRSDNSVRSAESSDQPAPVSECPVSMQTLPFAAAATVTDIMKLTGENRILVRYGLKLLSETENTGMRSLIQSCGLEGKKLTAGHIGFILGPCMNASGRLDSALRAVGLLLETDQRKAGSEAQMLAALNDRRKEMTEAGKEAAFEKIEQQHLLEDRVLIIYLEGVHESLAGIIASKVKETMYRPVMVFTDTEDPALLKGSGRSVEAYNMHDELSRVSDLFVRFGGHAMAAGVTMERKLLDQLRSRLNENCTLTQEDLMMKIVLDAAPPLSALHENLISELNLLEPYGPGNRAPLFGCSQVQLLKLRVLGKNRNCIKMTVGDTTCRREAMLFEDADMFLSLLKERFGEQEVRNLINGSENQIRLTLAYRPEIDDYWPEHTVQLRIAHFQ